MDTLEARLVKIDGVRSAKVRGLDKESKFYFNLRISEEKSVLPETVRKMLAELKKATNGDDDYPYNSMEITSITGTVEKSGEEWSLTARGSKQKYALVPNEALRKQVAAGKTLVTLAGRLTDVQGVLKLEISDVKDPAN